MLKKVELPNSEVYTYREVKNDQPTLLLIHGNMTSSQHYDVLIEALKDDFNIIAPDLRGFGGSTYHKEISSLKDFSEDIYHFMNALDISNATIAGWSTGGGIAMRLAIDHPEYVEKLILIESVGIKGYPIYKKDDKGQPIPDKPLLTKAEIAKDIVQVLPILNAYAQKDKETLRQIWDAIIYVNDKPEASQYDIYLEDMLTQRNLVDVDYALTRFNISEENNGVVDGTGEVKTIHKETLIFQGINDLVVPEAMGDGIYEALGDQAKIVKGDWGHSPLIDALDVLEKEIKEFV